MSLLQTLKHISRLFPVFLLLTLNMYLFADTTLLNQKHFKCIGTNMSHVGQHCAQSKILLVQLTVVNFDQSTQKTAKKYLLKFNNRYDRYEICSDLDI